MKKWKKRLLFAGGMMATGGLLGAAVLPARIGFVAGKGVYGAVKGWQVSSALFGAGSSLVSIDGHEEEDEEENVSEVNCFWCGRLTSIDRDRYPWTSEGVDFCNPCAEKYLIGDTIADPQVSAAFQDVRKARSLLRESTKGMLFGYWMALNKEDWKNYERFLVRRHQEKA